jgi:hypothetical protein
MKALWALGATLDLSTFCPLFPQRWLKEAQDGSRMKDPGLNVLALQVVGLLTL